MYFSKNKDCYCFVLWRKMTTDSLVLLKENEADNLFTFEGKWYLFSLYTSQKIRTLYLVRKTRLTFLCTLQANEKWYSMYFWNKMKLIFLVLLKENETDNLCIVLLKEDETGVLCTLMKNENCYSWIY